MIREDIKTFIKTIPSNVKLVAATKYADDADLITLFESGINDFGENRVDSFLRKYELLSNLHICWHFIGHLQTNKAKEVINKIDYLHSLDSLKLANLISKFREKPLKCFVDVSINEEENKNGVFVKDLSSFLDEVLKLKNIEIIGFMMMSKKGSTKEELVSQFNSLVKQRDLMEKAFNKKFPYISMGMSSDYLQAIECGATHIRLGRILYKQ